MSIVAMGAIRSAATNTPTSRSAAKIAAATTTGSFLSGICGCGGGGGDGAYSGAMGVPHL